MKAAQYGEKNIYELLVNVWELHVPQNLAVKLFSVTFHLYVTVKLIQTGRWDEIKVKPRHMRPTAV